MRGSSIETSDVSLNEEKNNNSDWKDLLINASIIILLGTNLGTTINVAVNQSEIKSTMNSHIESSLPRLNRLEEIQLKILNNEVPATAGRYTKADAERDNAILENDIKRYLEHNYQRK